MWNIPDRWPEPNKVTVRRRVKELQQQAKTAERQVEDRGKRIERLRRQIAELEQED